MGFAEVSEMLVFLGICPREVVEPGADGGIPEGCSAVAESRSGAAIDVVDDLMVIDGEEGAGTTRAIGDVGELAGRRSGRGKEDAAGAGSKNGELGNSIVDAVGEDMSEAYKIYKITKIYKI